MTDHEETKLTTAGGWCAPTESLHGYSLAEMAEGYVAPPEVEMPYLSREDQMRAHFGQALPPVIQTTSPYPPRRGLAEVYAEGPTRATLADELSKRFAAEDARMRAEVLPAPPEGYDWVPELVWDSKYDYEGVETGRLYTLTADVTARLAYKLRPTP